MKESIYLINMLLAALMLFGCTEEEHTPLSEDGVSPQVITDIEVEPLNGGFNITYNLPKDEDLLYVKAYYTNSKGEESTVVSSAYKKSVEIVGYGDTEEKTIKLQTIDRSQNRSEFVTVTGVPLEPVVNKVAKTITMTEGWGGLNYQVINSEKDELIIDLIANEIEINEETGNRSYGKFKALKTLYTKLDTITAVLRGYDPVPTTFAALVKDIYGNTSDTIYPSTPNGQLIPWEEILLDKDKITEAKQPNDNNWSQWGTSFLNALDGVLGSNASNVTHTEDNAFPFKLTIDLGADVILSRFKIWKNDYGSLSSSYGHNNPRTMEVYGASTIPNTDGSLDGWTYLGRFEAIKPSGSGAFTPADEQHVLEGDEFEFDNAPELRYMKILFLDNWGGTSSLSFSEISFWGRYN
ncbi:DUF5000 domain-containing lipoprotein [Maribacter ulvicola]|uniref:F5/8 type C domain-containing protein n=1 Tax=Maribacter ulvicola TaxID=228959 RepID=A0A1N6YAG8_9FLAO|nr:DUF5000 domain-containing lipoprotein [Maribacter ulvicola]SIR11481.1 protein of unknown function [Maribacter ulvicola]